MFDMPKVTVDHKSFMYYDPESNEGKLLIRIGQSIVDTLSTDVLVNIYFENRYTTLTFWLPDLRIGTELNVSPQYINSAGDSIFTILANQANTKLANMLQA